MKKHLSEKNIKAERPKMESIQTQAMTSRRISQRRKATTIFQRAENLIYGPRNSDYGHPTDNFKNIANLWKAYLEAIEQRPYPIRQLNNLDVANLNILQKVARLATNQGHMDSIMDIAGYAGCQERIISQK